MTRRRAMHMIAVRATPEAAVSTRRKTVSTATTDTARPGISVGPTSEFSLFFHVRAGQGAEIRDAINVLQNSPGYRPGDSELPIATIHEARFVLFDNDTRLLFATS